MTTNIALLDRRANAVPRGVASAQPIFAARANGHEIWDVEGRRYLDFASGIAVTNLGHGHSAINAAVSDQLQRFSHVAFQVTPYESYIGLAERLNQLVPGSSPKKTLFVTTGAEANENAIKIARLHTGRSAVIAFTGGFHGRTSLGMALTGKVQPYKAGIGTSGSDVYHVPFPNALHGISEADSLRAIDYLLKASVGPDRVAAIILEPVQGEGGFNVASPEFLKTLRALCDEHGIVFILDEVQCGFARTGKMFAHEYADVEADLVPMAKALGGGMPLAAVTGKAHIMDAPAPGGLGGTYGGAPAAIAAGHAVLDTIDKEQLCERASVIGARMSEALTCCINGPTGRYIGEVRALGAMVALEFWDKEEQAPRPDLAAAAVANARAAGLIVLSCGLYGNVLRLIPPLTITDDALEEGLDILASAIADAKPA